MSVHLCNFTSGNVKMRLSLETPRERSLARFSVFHVVKLLP